MKASSCWSIKTGKSVNAATLLRMIDVLKGTWIYKLHAGEDRKEAPEFKVADLKEIVYEELHQVPSLLVTMKDGRQRLAHPNDLNMIEIEALTSWAEDRTRKT